MTRENAIRELKIFSGTTTGLSANFCEALNTAIKALKQEPCDDCVSRQAVIDYLHTNMAWYDENGSIADDSQKLRDITNLVNGILPFTPTHKKGRWIKVTETEFGNGYQCSECGRFILTESIDGKKLKDFPYCHCGAEMESEE